MDGQAGAEVLAAFEQGEGLPALAGAKPESWTATMTGAAAADAPAPR